MIGDLFRPENRDLLAVVAYSLFVLLVIGGCFAVSLCSDLDALEDVAARDEETQQ